MGGQSGFPEELTKISILAPKVEGNLAEFFGDPAQFSGKADIFECGLHERANSLI